MDGWMEGADGGGGVGGGGGVTDCVCRCMKLGVPSEACLSGDVDRRNAMVGRGFDVSVEKRLILSSVIFGSVRDEGVRMRNNWVVERCCWVVWEDCGWMGRARSWVWRLVSAWSCLVVGSWMA